MCYFLFLFFSPYKAVRYCINISSLKLYWENKSFVLGLKYNCISYLGLFYVKNVFEVLIIKWENISTQWSFSILLALCLVMELVVITISKQGVSQDKSLLQLLGWSCFPCPFPGVWLCGVWYLLLSWNLCHTCYICT